VSKVPEKDEKKPIPILTPFGKVEVPQPELPPAEPPKMTRRRHEAMKHAVGLSIAQLVPIPPVSDAAEDIHGKELRDILTPEEKEKYIRYDKTAPSLAALTRTFMELRKEEE